MDGWRSGDGACGDLTMSGDGQGKARRGMGYGPKGAVDGGNAEVESAGLFLERCPMIGRLRTYGLWSVIAGVLILMAARCTPQSPECRDSSPLPWFWCSAEQAR